MLKSFTLKNKNLNENKRLFIPLWLAAYFRPTAVLVNTEVPGIEVGAALTEPSWRLVLRPRARRSSELRRRHLGSFKKTGSKLSNNINNKYL